MEGRRRMRRSAAVAAKLKFPRPLWHQICWSGVALRGLGPILGELMPKKEKHWLWITHVIDT